MSVSGRETPLNKWQWSGGPTKSPGVVWRPSRMFGSGREAFSDDREWSGVSPGNSGGPPGCPGVVGTPSRLSGSGERPS